MQALSTVMQLCNLYSRKRIIHRYAFSRYEISRKRLRTVGLENEFRRMNLKMKNSNAVESKATRNAPQSGSKSGVKLELWENQKRGEYKHPRCGVIEESILRIKWHDKMRNEEALERVEGRTDIWNCLKRRDELIGYNLWHSGKISLLLERRVEDKNWIGRQES